MNERYGVFTSDKDKVVGVKTEPLFTESLKKTGKLDILLTGGKKTNYVERNYVTYKKTKTEDKIYNAIGALFGIMSTITTGKQDYRAVNVYRNRDDYSKATRGMGRVLNYMK